MVILKFTRWALSYSSLPGRFVIVDFVARLIRRRGVQRVEGYIGNYSFEFDFSDELQRQMYFGLYDQAEMALVSRILGDGDVFLDIGANVGYYSLWASQTVGETGQVHAFEPIAENAQKLVSALQRNAVKNTCVNQVAVGATKGMLVLHIAAKSMGNSGWASIVSSERRPGTVSVPQVSIDDYLLEQGIESVRLVKLDIEGAEPEAIIGMRGLLANSDAPELLCEVNPWLLDQRGLDSTAITHPLSTLGFQLHALRGAKVEPIDAAHPVTQLTNIFCSKSE